MERVTLTSGQLCILLNATGSNRKMKGPEVRSLIAALHAVRQQGSNRWATEMSPTDISVAIDILEAHQRSNTSSPTASRSLGLWAAANPAVQHVYDTRRQARTSPEEPSA